MKFICVQPDSDYYLWQLKVVANNFKKYGIEDQAVFILGYRSIMNENVRTFTGTTSAKVVLVQDTRNDPKYIPSLRPHLLKKYWSGNTITEPVFYHDADMIFTYGLPDFGSMTKNKLYVSDTISYIGSKYIRQKGEGLFNQMCETVGIEPDLVISNEFNSGGAQYYFNFMLSSDYWEKVERDCESLYQLMIGSKYSPEHPIQAWTADMWSVLWNVWLLGYESEVHNDLDFCWATDLIDKWHKKKIFHNAGVTGDRPELFCKSLYTIASPFSADLSHISDKYCSFKYVQEIKKIPDSPHN